VIHLQVPGRVVVTPSPVTRWCPPDAVPATRSILIREKGLMMRDIAK
jgi:hypothetical protein